MARKILEVPVEEFVEAYQKTGIKPMQMCFGHCAVGVLAQLRLNGGSRHHDWFKTADIVEDDDTWNFIFAFDGRYGTNNSSVPASLPASQHGIVVWNAVKDLNKEIV